MDATRSLNRTGSFCCFGYALAIVTVAVFFLLLPVKTGVFDPASFLRAYVENKVLYRAYFSAFAAAAIFGLGTVPAVAGQVRLQNEGLTRWMMALAYLGYCVLALSNFRTLGLIDNRADVFLSLDETGQKILSGTSIALDQHAYLTFGAPGLWILTVSFLLLKEGSAKLMAWVGLLLGVMCELVVVGWSTPSLKLVIGLASTGGLIVGPVWYVMMGLRLRKAS